MLILMTIIESNGSDKTSIFIALIMDMGERRESEDRSRKINFHETWTRLTRQSMRWVLLILVLIRHLENAMKKMLKFAHKLFSMFYSSGSFFVHKHRHLHYTGINVMHAPKSAFIIFISSILFRRILLIYFAIGWHQKTPSI